MGKDKALLEVRGETLLARAARLLSTVTDPVLVATRFPDRHASPGVRVVQDQLEPPCALAGIHAILSEMPTDAAFICATDMPYLNPDLIRHLHSKLGTHDAVMPRGPRGLEGLHAIFSRRCLRSIESAVAEGRLAVAKAIDSCDVLIVPIDETAWLIHDESPFTNLNTREEFETFLDRIA
jgi:molybdopterin-guanine dinucleotide biosynthesis protein A